MIHGGLIKTNLILSEWPEYKVIKKFKANTSNIRNLIEFISNIRSTKAELKITPKLFCDIHFLEKSSKLNTIVRSNLNLAKHVGRIRDISNSKKIDKNAVEILSQNEKVLLIFSENIDLISQKIRITQKIENLDKQISNLKNKLKNQAYINNAPNEIVQNDKKLLNELTIEEGKLKSIVSSIN